MGATGRSVSPSARGSTPRGGKTPTGIATRITGTALNAMAIIGMIGRIDDSRTMIDALMSRSGG